MPSTGQLDSGLIDGQQWPRDSSTTWQFDEWFIFFYKDKHKTNLFAKWGGLYHCWTQVKWGLCISVCKKCMYLSVCFPVGGHSFLLWLSIP